MRTLDRSTKIRLSYLLIVLVLALASCIGTSKATLYPLHGLPAPSDGTADWSYFGPNGPEAWGNLASEYATCAYGQMQSPIDIALARYGDVPSVQFHYSSSRVVVKNTGRTVQATFDPGNWIQLNGITYRLIEFHYHHPGEHLINGTPAPIEVHLVHQDDAGDYAVVAVMFDRGTTQNGALRRVLAVDPDNSDIQPVTHLNATDLLPEKRDYAMYDGSLTTPPCTEGVKWVVMGHRGILTPQQVDKLNDLVPPNARPVQILGARALITNGKVNKE